MTRAAAKETFTDRFNRLTEGHSDEELATFSGMKYSTVRDIRTGKTMSIKLDAALALCKRLGFSPWTLQGVPEPGHTFQVEVEGVCFAVALRVLQSADAASVKAAQAAIADALSSASREIKVTPGNVSRLPAVATPPAASDETAALGEPTTRELLVKIEALQRSLAETEDRVAALATRRRQRAAGPKPGEPPKQSTHRGPS